MNKKCQVFTPENYVRELLDSVGYTEHLYGRKILENSCGDGNILVAVVQRYIDDCVANGLSRTRIKNGLARDIYGVEIDLEQFQKCIENLNKVLEKNNGNIEMEWVVVEYNENRRYSLTTDELHSRIIPDDRMSETKQLQFHSAKILSNAMKYYSNIIFRNLYSRYVH